MKARMQELLGLLTLVVERVRACNERAERAESRAAQMGAMLDALSDDNAALRVDLEQAEEEALGSRETIRALREQVVAGERLIEALETCVSDAELRIQRAADALAPAVPVGAPLTIGEESAPSIALH